MSGYFDSLNRRARANSDPLISVHPIKPPAPVPAGLRPGDMEAEFGALREKLLVLGNGAPLKSLVFAGCVGGEGCTQVVQDFSDVLARSGVNVLLVDGDLRTSGLTTSLAVGGASLTELVSTGAHVEGADWGKGKLTVVPSPAAHPDKEHFFQTPEFGNWLASQRGGYDYVVLDAPPLLKYADATLMGRVSDGVVIVARAETTERSALVRAREQLERAGVKIVGVVLNRTRQAIPALLRPYLSDE